MKSHCVYGSDDCNKCKPMNTKEQWEKDLIEKLASIEHDRWSHWQKYMHSKMIPSEHDGIWQISESHIKHWDLQIATPYSELTEEEKQSDRNQVMKYFDLIRETREQAKKEERERIAKLLNKALNKHSKTISDGGLDYVKAFQEVEKLEHELFFGE